MVTVLSALVSVCSSYVRNLNRPRLLIFRHFFKFIHNRRVISLSIQSIRRDVFKLRGTSRQANCSSRSRG